MKKHLKFKRSFSVWKPSVMKSLIEYKSYYLGITPKSYAPYIIEWWLHNIGYWLTKPMVAIPFFKKINLRCRDVDLMIEGENNG